MTKTRGDVITLIIVTVIVTLFAAWVGGGIKKSVLPLRMNIFDEIFYDTQNYFSSGGNRLQKVEGLTSPRYGGLLGEPIGRGPEYSYTPEKIPLSYEFIEIDFNYIDTREKTVNFYFKKYIDGQTMIVFSNLYNPQTKVLNVTAEVRTISVTNGESLQSYDDPVSQEALSQLSITSEDLDSYNKAILNDLVLADWTTVYDSRFSPDNYGDVEVTKQW